MWSIRTLLSALLVLSVAVSCGGSAATTSGVDNAGAAGGVDAVNDSSTSEATPTESSTDSTGASEDDTTTASSVSPSTTVADSPSSVSTTAGGVESGDVSADLPLTASGFGPLVAGMGVSEANEILVDDLTFSDYDIADGYCYFAESDDLPGVIIMMVGPNDGPTATPEDGIIGRFSLFEPFDDYRTDFVTDTGIAPGDPESTVFEAYPDGSLEIEPHVYVEAGSYLTVIPESDEAEFRLRYFTDGSVVNAIHAGLEGPSAYIEGCL